MYKPGRITQLGLRSDQKVIKQVFLIVPYDIISFLLAHCSIEAVFRKKVLL